MFGIANTLSFIFTLLFVIATNVCPQTAKLYGVEMLFSGGIDNFFFGGIVLLLMGAGVHVVSWIITIPIAFIYVAVTGPVVDMATGHTRRERLLLKAQTGRTSTKYMSFEEKEAWRAEQIRLARERNNRIDLDADVHPALRVN